MRIVSVWVFKMRDIKKEKDREKERIYRIIEKESNWREINKIYV